MPVPSAAVGHTTAPQVIEITPRWTIAYAAGLGDTNPVYFDDASSTGIVAHPAFCVALEWPVALALRQHSLSRLTPLESLRGVHAAQDSTFHRPIRPGDRLRTVGTVVQVRPIRPGAFVLTKYETVDDTTDVPVVTSYASTIYRGIAVVGEEAQHEEAPALPAVSHAEATSCDIPIPIARQAPHVYTECARIWNPIHTERRVALEAGLPDIILHGTATWALAAGVLIHHCAAGDPTRLRRFIGRFTAMVIPGTTITVRCAQAQYGGSSVAFRVCNAEGAAAISGGVAVFAPAVHHPPQEG